MTTSHMHAYQQRYGLRPEHELPVCNETLMLQLKHRSCRKFTEEIIPNDVLSTLLASAFSAPSKSDLQQISVINIADIKIKAEIISNNPLLKWVEQAPVLLIWCGDSRRIRTLSDHREHTFANDHLDAFMNAAVDAGMVMQNFIISAESIGLGCCPISQVRDSINSLSNILKLPKWVFPVAGLAVGFPQDAGHVSMRLPNTVTVHQNVYDDTNDVQHVGDYDKRREGVHPTPDAAQLHPQLFGISEEYGWSEQHTRQYAVPMRTDFGDYIRKQGFNLK